MYEHMSFPMGFVGGFLPAGARVSLLVAEKRCFIRGNQVGSLVCRVIKPIDHLSILIRHASRSDIATSKSRYPDTQLSWSFLQPAPTVYRSMTLKILELGTLQSSPGARQPSSCSSS
jgi:hypothetical protein